MIEKLRQQNFSKTFQAFKQNLLEKQACQAMAL